VKEKRIKKNSMAAIGTIYVLANPAIPGLVKVGKTTRSVDARIKELSSATGVPSEFMLIYEQTFLDVDNAESQIHVILESRGYRHASNREFFNAKPSDVIKIINTIKGKADDLIKTIKAHDTDGNPAFDFGEDESDKLGDSRNPVVIENYLWYEIWEEAEDYFYGSNDCIQDYSDAMEMYLKAFKLGCPFVPQRLGDIFLAGEGIARPDKVKALEYYKQGVKSGDYYCYLKMGILYYEDGNPENTKKCLNSFIEKFAKKDIVIEYKNNFASSVGALLYVTFEKHDLTIEQKDFIRKNKLDILRSIQEGIEYVNSMESTNHDICFLVSKTNRLHLFVEKI